MVSSDAVRANIATVGIIGLGYVGLPLALRACEVGYDVVGFDVNSQLVDMLNSGKSHISHIPHERLAKSKSKFEASCDFSRVSACDAIVICVPTPLTKNRVPDLSFVVSTLEAIGDYLTPGQLLTLESTTWPGTTQEIIGEFISDRGFTIGQNFFLAYSPEREDPGNKSFSTQSIPKVVGGMTEICMQRAIKFYKPLVDELVPVSSTSAAEMVKLLENIHRAVNIGLVNEMKMIASQMGLDIFEIIRAAATKPFGFTPYFPGPGIGGHCIPIDPFYLTWKAKEYGINTKFIELAGEVNASMPSYVVRQVSLGLNSRGIAMSRSRVLVLGLAYKPDVDDCRESPSWDVIELLEADGCTVEYHDPFFTELPKMRNHSYLKQSVELTEESLGLFDAVVILTAHSEYDFQWIKEHSSLVVDTRGVLEGNNVIQA